MKNTVLPSLRIEDYTSEGFGVARFDGRAVFVPGGARGDLCDIKIVGDQGGVLYGIIEKLAEPSQWRENPRCPAYGPCGGCCFRHISYSEEIDAKRRRVEETMRRVGEVHICAEDVIGAPTRDGWRNKAAFPVGTRGGKPVTGFYRRRSHDICPVGYCAMCTHEQNAAAEVLREWIAQTGRTGGIRNLFVRQGDGGVQVCVSSAGKPDRPDANRLVRSMRERVPGLCGVLWDHHPGTGNGILSGNLKTLWGTGRLADSLGGINVSLSPMSFYQINKPQAERLYTRALEYAGDFNDAVDLYCGAGTLTLLLSRRGAATGVDIVPEAIEDAKAAAAANGAENARFICADAGVYLGLKPDLVVVDPPRKGLSRESIRSAVSLSPRKIVYISCDPATLARDVKTLSGHGFAPARMTVADLFPGTPHVETMVLLERRE